MELYKEYNRDLNHDHNIIVNSTVEYRFYKMFHGS